MSAAAMTSSPKTSPHSSKPLLDVYRRRMLIPARHELKEQQRTGAADREIADLVHHEHRRMREHLEAGLQASGSLRLFQRRDQVG
jgi:hypothetical protein